MQNNFEIHSAAIKRFPAHPASLWRAISGGSFMTIMVSMFDVVYAYENDIVTVSLRISRDEETRIGGR